ncbi:MAG: hypothetical protein IKT52_13215 [Oscillospiraceae bacterium]|nr:hypothetical protein [Oscillospiraceae bacterium]
MLNYFLVICATILFSLQFLFNQQFQKENGEDLKSTLVFSLYQSIVVAIIMLFIGKFHVEFTLYSLAMAALYAVVCISMTYFSLKAFAVTNLSVYSVFSMLGGMLLPFLLGVAFYDEGLSPSKVICCLLIILSVMLNMKKEKGSMVAFFYYMAVFVLNGMAGVLSKIHQSSTLPHVDSTSYMILMSTVSVVICLVWLILKYRCVPLIKGKSLVYVSGYGIFNGVGNLFLLIALSTLPASVQYPLVTGGVMVFSTLISMIRKEDLTLKDYISTLVAFAASVLIVF